MTRTGNAQVRRLGCPAKAPVFGAQMSQAKRNQVELGQVRRTTALHELGVLLCSGSLNRVAKNADAADFNFDHIAILHEHLRFAPDPDTGRRSR